MSCDYCDEMRGIKTVYNKIYGDRDRVVCETKSFVVFPCMGQLREGHLLIASKAHKNAIGMLEEEAIRELESLIVDIAGFFWDAYHKDVLCFEHGVLNDGGGNGGCGIYHMHLHLIPADREEFSSALDMVRGAAANTVAAARGLQDTRALVASGKTYLFLALCDRQGGKDPFIVVNENDYFESQYMRKVISKVFGKAEWDWRKIQEPEPELLRTLEKGRAALG